MSAGQGGVKAHRPTRASAPSRERPVGGLAAPPAEELDGASAAALDSEVGHAIDVASSTDLCRASVAGWLSRAGTCMPRAGQGEGVTVRHHGSAAGAGVLPMRTAPLRRS